jgi:hypothetical protein
MFRSVAASLVLALSFATASTAFAVQSYPLVCRGGGGTLGHNSYNRVALFYFQKASGPAGAGLAPGQCAWVDRAVGAGEPTCVMQNNVGAASWIFPNNLGGSYHTSDAAPWLRSLLNANQFQTFQSYNPGNGNCFVVTRLGP